MTTRTTTLSTVMTTALKQYQRWTDYDTNYDIDRDIDLNAWTTLPTTTPSAPNTIHHDYNFDHTVTNRTHDFVKKQTQRLLWRKHLQDGSTDWHIWLVIGYSTDHNTDFLIDQIDQNAWTTLPTTTLSVPTTILTTTITAINASPTELTTLFKKAQRLRGRRHL